MMTRLFFPLTLAGVALLAAPGLAQEPSGAVTFSGPGAAQLPSSVFEPASYEFVEGAWLFLDVSGTVGIFVARSSLDATGASFASVSEDGGQTWLDLRFSDIIPGITIDGDTITLVDVQLPPDESSGAEPMTMNGTLTGPIQVATEASTWSEQKSTFAGRP